MKEGNMTDNVIFQTMTSSASDSGSGEDMDSQDGSEILPLTITTDLGPHSPNGPSRAPKSPSKAALKKRIRAPPGSAKPEETRVLHTHGRRTLYTAGRPPWYNKEGQLKNAFVIGLCGGSASGKTTVARKIIEALDVPWVSLVSMDSFYKVLNHEQHERAIRNEYDFDHPDAFDFDLVVSTIGRLKEGKSVNVPIYNFATHSREKTMKIIYGANVVIFEGIMAFANAELLKLMDMKVFVDTDSDIRLARRLRRDIAERGREPQGVLKQYMTFVKPSFEHYIEPSMRSADIIVPKGGENDVAINLIVLHVHNQLQARGFKLRSKLAQSAHNGQPMPGTLHILEKTPQVNGLHSFIRDKTTSRDEFIFYSKRLMRLLFEFALSMLPFREVLLDTPQGIPYKGRRLAVEKIAGVSILRAGETMEQALCEVCKDVSIGKILIQTNLDTGEPELHYTRLPRDIKDHHIFLLDATVATGAAAMMAIRVLLDHDVPEEKIFLCSLLMAESGIHTVAYAFPKVNIVTTAVDKEMNEDFHILPGIGNFGDRYFGTDFSD
ncbi:uridine-cytidine kinase-like 1 isoform X2 [Physella acuta]|uniref:uridine-cytidine kinase-like 1 isoform X2 n=1 Tax=Physella acuta TaxID=109671 RepID=UPI0027DBA18D|nr:uridine-cytidine kinase-like 1 isoform X2 [Physella acuta]